MSFSVDLLYFNIYLTSWSSRMCFIYPSLIVSVIQLLWFFQCWNVASLIQRKLSNIRVKLNVIRICSYLISIWFHCLSLLICLINIQGHFENNEVMMLEIKIGNASIDIWQNIFVVNYSYKSKFCSSYCWKPHSLGIGLTKAHDI